MRTLFSMVLCAAVLLGCETTVEVDVAAHTPQLVVTGLIEPGRPWHVLVQRTAGTGETAPDLPVAVPDATVTIRADGGSEIVLRHRGGGFYHAAGPLPEAGAVYHLQAAAEGFAPVQASTRLPAPAPVTAFRLDATPAEHRAEITLADPGTTRDFYEVFVLDDARFYPVPFTVVNPELMPQLQALDVDDLFDPERAGRPLERVLLHDGPFDGTRFTLRLAVESPWNAATATVYVRAVSEAYYRYMRSIRLQKGAAHHPFIEPVAARSNIRGGQGVFAGFTTWTAGPASPDVLHRQVVGSYRLSRYHGEIDDVPFDYRPDGAAGTLTLHADGTATGTLYLPDPARPDTLRRFSLDGGYTLHDGLVRLFHDADTALRDMTFRRDPQTGALTGGLAPHLASHVTVVFTP